MTKSIFSITLPSVTSGTARGRFEHFKRFNRVDGFYLVEQLSGRMSTESTNKKYKQNLFFEVTNKLL